MKNRTKTDANSNPSTTNLTEEDVLKLIDKSLVDNKIKKDGKLVLDPSVIDKRLKDHEAMLKQNSDDIASLKKDMTELKKQASAQATPQASQAPQATPQASAQASLPAGCIGTIGLYVRNVSGDCCSSIEAAARVAGGQPTEETIVKIGPGGTSRATREDVLTAGIATILT